MEIKFDKKKEITIPKGNIKTIYSSDGIKLLEVRDQINVKKIYAVISIEGQTEALLLWDEKAYDKAKWDKSEDILKRIKEII